MDIRRTCYSRIFCCALDSHEKRHDPTPKTQKPKFSSQYTNKSTKIKVPNIFSSDFEFQDNQLKKTIGKLASHHSAEDIIYTGPCYTRVRQCTRIGLREAF